MGCFSSHGDMWCHCDIRGNWPSIYVRAGKSEHTTGFDSPLFIVKIYYYLAYG